MKAEATPVYYHYCKVLGPDTKVPRALLADKDGEYILCYQHKCVFCSYVAGEPELAKGVFKAKDGGYYVDTKIAEKLHNN